jgi:hypothetical protein
MRPADLQEEAEHAVVAHLQGGDARAGDLAGLVVGDPGLASAGQFTELVEPRVAAGLHEPAVAGEDGAALAERGRDPRGDVGARVEPLAEIREQACRAIEDRAHVGQDRGGVADPFEVAGPGAA